MRFARLSLLLLAFSVSACNLNSPNLPTPNADNIIYVTATPDLPTPDAMGVIYITATPLPSAAQTQSVPPPAPSDTPFVLLPPTLPPTLAFTQPYELLAKAQQQQQDGFYEDAASSYALILAQGDALAEDIRAEAALRLAQSALKDGFFEQAEAAASALIARFPNDVRAHQAYFLRGDAYLGLSRWQDAINDFTQYLALRPNLVDSYAYERIGDAQLALGQLENALTSYKRAVDANRTLVPQLVLREKLARILASNGRTAEAVAQYDAILAVARNHAYRASIELLAGQTLLNGGSREEGLARLRLVFDNYNDTRSAYTAMQALVQHGVSLTGFARGKVSFQYGDYQSAITAFNEHTSTFLLSDIPDELYLLLGRAYREIGNAQAAIVAFQTIVQQYPNSSLLGSALLEQGRTRFLSGDVDGAIQTYLALARDYAALSDAAAEALWRAGYLYGTNGQPTLARETFVRLADTYPQSTWASNGLFIAASTAVSNEEWLVAENLYGRIAAISTGNDRAAAYLWVGRLARQRGDLRTSDEALQLARSTAPDSFFGLRAADILNNVEPFTPPAQFRWTFDEAADRAEAEAWLRQTFAITQEGNLAALAPTLQADPRFIRGSELWALAAYDEALTEFTALLDEARANKDALTSYQLAIALRERGAFSSSIVAAADVIVASGVPTLQAPAYLARMRYPIYYSHLVLEQQARYGFDPLVLFALIRQESLYNTNATSSAQARGLTQVIPSTGRYIAGKLNYANFQDVDLYRPHVGIAFGAFYLDEQLRLFKGNVAAALAAYNAGPGRALDWVKLSGGGIDALMVTIQFEETRRYLERIYSHYAIYRALYGA